MTNRLHVVRTKIVQCSAPGCDELGEADLAAESFLCPTHYAAWQFVVWCVEQLRLIEPAR